MIAIKFRQIWNVNAHWETRRPQHCKFIPLFDWIIRIQLMNTSSINSFRKTRQWLKITRHGDGKQRPDNSPKSRPFSLASSQRPTTRITARPACLVKIKVPPMWAMLAGNSFSSLPFPSWLLLLLFWLLVLLVISLPNCDGGRILLIDSWSCSSFHKNSHWLILIHLECTHKSTESVIPFCPLSVVVITSND